MFIRAYLRASTEDQDAERARKDLTTFAEDHSLSIAAWYVENESGAKLDRPQLSRLLSDCQPGDTLLVEQIDRLSRLNSKDWDKLKHEVSSRGMKIVALDLPTSHSMAVANSNEVTDRIFAAVNDMLLDVLAAVARKDYEDRRRRQEQGIEKAKIEGKYRGRREDTERNNAIVKMLRDGMSWNDIVSATKCSRSTLSRLAKRIKEAESS